MARKKKGIQGKYVIIVSAIILLNLIGVGYGYWNGGLKLSTTVSTGKIEVELVEEGNSIEGIEIMQNPYDNTISINGEVPAGYSGILSYSIRNTGSIPILIEGERVELQGKSSPMLIEINAGDEDGYIQVDGKIIVEQSYE